jgi:hypothetical protein
MHTLTLALLLPVVGALMTVIITAQSPGGDTPAQTAAFLYTVAKFTKWPAEALPAGAPLVICAIDDLEVANALAQAVGGQRIDEHPLAVWRGNAEGPINACHVLYLGDTNALRTSLLLAAVKGHAVLTVGVLPTFTKIGGTVRLFVENGHVRFAVEVGSAHELHLRLSSEMLKLATIVKDGPHDSPR